MARRQTNLDGMGKEIAESQKKSEFDPCSVNCSGMQCEFPATFRIEGRLLCRFHFRCPGHLMEGVVRESRRWCADREAGRDLPMTYVRHDGVEVPGFPHPRQLRQAHDEWLRTPAPRYMGPGPTLGASARILPREPGDDDEDLQEAA